MATKATWIPVSPDKLPKMAKHPIHGHLFNISEPILVKTEDGNSVPGYCRQYRQGVDAPHIQAKKDDYYFESLLGARIEDVVSYYPLKGIAALLEPEKQTKKAEASQ